MGRHEADHYAATRRVARVALELDRAIRERRMLDPIVQRLEKAVADYRRTAERA